MKTLHSLIETITAALFVHSTSFYKKKQAQISKKWNAFKICFIIRISMKSWCSFSVCSMKLIKNRGTYSHERKSLSNNRLATKFPSRRWMSLVHFAQKFNDRMFDQMNPLCQFRSIDSKSDEESQVFRKEIGYSDYDFVG